MDPNWTAEQATAYVRALPGAERAAAVRQLAEVLGCDVYEDMLFRLRSANCALRDVPKTSPKRPPPTPRQLPARPSQDPEDFREDLRQDARIALVEALAVPHRDRRELIASRPPDVVRQAQRELFRLLFDLGFGPELEDLYHRFDAGEPVYGYTGVADDEDEDDEGSWPEEGPPVRKEFGPA